MTSFDSTLRDLKLSDGSSVSYYSLTELDRQSGGGFARLPRYLQPLQS